MPNTAVYLLPSVSLIRNMKTVFSLFILTAVIFVSCKKTEDEKPQVNNPPASDIEMNRICAAPWKAYQVDVNNMNIWDLLIEPCQKDDTYKFNRDSSLIHYENANVCSGMPDSSSSEWTFYEGRKKLIGTILGITDTAEIVTLQDNEMKLSVDYNGMPALIYFKKN